MNHLVRQTDVLPKRLKTNQPILLFAQIAQSVEQGTENPRVGGSIPPLGTTIISGSGSVVEHRLAKARVAGSNPVFRSNLYGAIAKW